MHTKLLGGLMIGLLVLGGCADDGDDEATNETSKAGGETTEEEAAELTGLDTSFGQNGVLATALSPAEHDRFLAVTPGPGGSYYAAGWTETGEDHAMVLAKFGEDGALDQTFGQAGVATVNVTPGGKVVEVARAVVVQSDGKIVISGPIEKDPKATGLAAKDTDVALVRFDATGKPDPTFGTEGIAKLDLGKGKALPDESYLADNAWGLVTLPDNKLVLFGSTAAPGREDADFTIAGITSAGALDPAFGTKGILTVDQNKGADTPRNMNLQPDGKIVATGYSRDAADVVSPVLIRFSSDGKLDTSFGTGGVATATVLPGGVAESYQFGLQGDNYVMGGYGHGADPEEKVDLISYRFTATGTWDKTYGTDGLTRIDLAGLDDRARNLLVLPDGRVLGIGVGTPAEAASDAMVVLLDESGIPVPAFGTAGRVLSDLGGPADTWFGATLARDGKSVMLVGYKGADTAGTENDDAAIACIKL